jgi:hypothetical protein
MLQYVAKQNDVIRRSRRVYRHELPDVADENVVVEIARMRLIASRVDLDAVDTNAPFRTLNSSFPHIEILA